MNEELYEYCVYTIIDEDRLLSADQNGNKSSPLFENSSWTRAEGWLADATSRGLRIPILFSDAKDVHRWLGWSLLVDVRVEKADPNTRSKTHYVFDYLRRPFEQERGVLRMASTGKPLSDGHRRPYVLFKTPEFLRKLAVSHSDALQPWLGSLAAVDYAVVHSFEPETQEDAAETLRLAVRSLQSAMARRWEAVVTPGRIRLYVGERLNPGNLVFDFDRYGIRWLGENVDQAGIEVEGGTSSEAEQESSTLAEFQGAVAKFVALARTQAGDEKEPTAQTLLLMKYGEVSTSRVDAQYEPSHDGAAPSVDMWSPWEQTALEGNPVLVHHFRRERNRVLVQRKIEQMIQTAGYLECQACGFRPGTAFPDVVHKICEVHHLRPLGESSAEVTTSLAELAILCPNCHRAIHGAEELPTIEEFQKKYFPNRVLITG